MVAFRNNPTWAACAETWEPWREADAQTLIALLNQRDTWLEAYLATLGAAVAAARATGSGLADTNITSAATYFDWGSTVSLSNPGISVNITATLHGYLADFTAIAVLNSRVGISIDNGSSYTFGNPSRDVAGQGGSNYNSATVTAAHARLAVTPTSTILVKGQAQSTLTTGTATNGILIVHMTAA